MLSGTEVWDRRLSAEQPEPIRWTRPASSTTGRRRRSPTSIATATDALTLSEWQWDRESFDRADRNGDRVPPRPSFSASEKVTPGEGSWSQAYRAGYERGQIEGRTAGREDRDRNQGYDLDGQRELETADSGYEARAGSRTEYQDGYRHGFRAAYPEGWNRR